MDLSEQGNLLTKISSSKSVGQMKKGVSGIELGGNLPTSHIPCESSCAGTNESSSLMVKSDAADADLLVAFDSISVSERLMLNDGVGTSGHNFDNEKDNFKYNFSDFASISEPSRSVYGAGEASVRVDQGGKLNHSLIVYTSSRRSASKTKLHHKESPKSLKCRRVASRNSMLNLSSLQMLQNSRTSFSKRAESSARVGCMGNISLDSEENSRADLNLVDEKQLTKVKGGKGKKISCRDKIGEQSNGNRCIPTGRISLKIKIGNKICGMTNATESLIPMIKDTLELSDTVDKLREVPEVVVPSHERNLEKVVPSRGSVLSTDLEARCSLDKTSFNSSSDFHQIISPEDSHNLRAACENTCSHIGTSPDSEVINTAPNAPLCEKGLTDLQESPIISKVCLPPNDISNLNLSPKKSKKVNKKDGLHQLSRCTLKIRLPGVESLNNAKVRSFHGDVSSSVVPQAKSKKEKKKKKVHNASNCRMKGMHMATEIKDDAKVHLDYGVGETAADAMNKSSGPYSICAETKPYPVPATIILCPNSDVSNSSVPCCNGLNSTKHSRGKGGRKGMSRNIDVPNKKDKTSKRKGNKNNASGEHQANDKFGAIDVLGGVENCLAAGNQPPLDLEENGALQFSSSLVRKQYVPQRNAWVLCDECQKWRRIPSTLADQIEETNCRWTCKENTDKYFADCSIPQEKSNSEINEELEISEASGEEDVSGALLKSNQNRPKVPQQSSWSLIKSNLFLHRSRKTQPIDEVMVCHCKPPSDGRMGCGAKCLNRMLNIECVKGTCPCGQLCSNQQFQKRKYGKLKWFRCGKKGFGLQALEDISQGQFLIEYVGEVLDVHTYEARQREYALDGHRHFYFMTLNGSEVIDACAKGNLARFINHSCSPNCRTEKWMVNGEVCVGLFALKDIKEGEEITFDYNYVRVFGAAAKKCVCGSPNCRGYIGGDPTNSEVIVQDDSDDEFSEPVMTCGDRELNEDWRDIMLNSANGGENATVNEPPGNRFSVKKLISTVDECITDSHASEPLTQRVEGVWSAQVEETTVRDTFEVGNTISNDSVELLNKTKVKGESSNGSISTDIEAGCGLQSQIHSSHCTDISLQTGALLDKATSSIHGLSVAVSPSKSLSDTVEPKKKLKYATVGGRGELATPSSLPKTNHSTSVRKGKTKTNVIRGQGSPDLDKLNTSLNKSRKLHEPNVNSHFEAVEEKLNELLDPEGGISKRKDASRGYLKLLFLTAASGTNGHGEAIQSSRDLSMILDALLKTKSRTVLVDIINKNGLQMLHNIMKRYRKEFIKTPILRKLLKVLEYLAVREILTLEHITGDPPREGVESFKDSMLTLTEHADKQVHQIARNFRDRWIPRSLRKSYCLEREKRYGFSDLSVPSDKGVKPSDVKCYSEKQSLAAPGTGETCTSSSGNDRVNRPKRKSRWDNTVAEYPHSRTRTNLAQNGHLNSDRDTPPGFSTPCIGPMVPPSAFSTGIHPQDIPMCIKQHPFDATLGDLQLRFSARLPVSYGIPYSVRHQVGIQPDIFNSSTVAPAFPFHPFPPLPPYAHGERALPSSTATCASMSEHAEKAAEHSNACFTSHNGQNHIRTCSSEPSENTLAFANQQPDFPRGASCSLGRKYFRQKKLTHSKFGGPPWVRMRNGRRNTGNNSRNDSPGVSSTDGANDFGDVYNS